jgi:hypothetical protein
MTEQVTENKELTDATQQAPAQESNDLNVNDLNAMKTIIDLASSRGAFKASEMMAVGQVYTKLSNFLAGVTKQSNQGA